MAHKYHQAMHVSVFVITIRRQKEFLVTSYVSYIGREKQEIQCQSEETRIKMSIQDGHWIPEEVKGQS